MTELANYAADKNFFKSRSYINIMQRFDSIFDYHNSGGVDDPDLIIDCHGLSVEIDKEIVTIHDFIRDNYLQLESPELDPIDFARLVKKPGQYPIVELEGLGLPSQFIMVFSSWRLGKAIEACDRILALDSTKKKVLNFVESRIRYVAPNLCAIVGNALAVKLMATAGGLSSLKKMDQFDIVRLGAKRKWNFAQFCYGGGYIEQSEIIQSTPPYLRLKACGMVALKCSCAAHLDLTREYPTGQLGTYNRKEICISIEQWQRKQIKLTAVPRKTN